MHLTLFPSIGPGGGQPRSSAFSDYQEVLTYPEAHPKVQVFNRPWLLLNTVPISTARIYGRRGLNPSHMNKGIPLVDQRILTMTND